MRLISDWPSAAARPGISRGLEGRHLAVGAPLRKCHDLISDREGGGIRGCQGSVAEASAEAAASKGIPCAGPRDPAGSAWPPCVPSLPLAVEDGAQPFSGRQVPVSTGKRLLTAQNPGNTRPAGAVTASLRPPADEARVGLAGYGCGARGALAAGGLSTAPSRAGDSSSYSPRCTVGLGRRWGQVGGGPSNSVAITAAGLGAALPDSDASLAG